MTIAKEKTKPATLRNMLLAASLASNVFLGLAIYGMYSGKMALHANGIQVAGFYDPYAVAEAR